LVFCLCFVRSDLANLTHVSQICYHLDEISASMIWKYFNASSNTITLEKKSE
jgi:hypothetical protein